MELNEIVTAQRRFFDGGNTLPVRARIAALKNLYNAIASAIEDAEDVLRADLGKNATEAYATEIAIVLRELKTQIRCLKKWSRPKRAGRMPLFLFPAKGVVYPVPYGVTLVMSPWNYPFQLSLVPAIEAIAAGNTVVVKPSAYAPATADLVERIFRGCFDPEWVWVVKGGRAENAALLDLSFDYIFFTGGKTVGRLVMEKAAAHLTPVTLELGGKSPCIVDHTANLALAARRIVYGKFLNCGQTCVAPDYLLVEASIKDRLVALIKREIVRQYGARPLKNPDYGKIVNDKHYRRILGLIEPDRVLHGGAAQDGRIEPTLTDADPDCPLMREEIFGPVLPVLTYSTREEALAVLAQNPSPLALYYFGKDRAAIDEAIRRVRFGGGCVNDTIMHLATDKLAFGGVGESGMGAYHGKTGFDTFTHYKSILYKSTALDPSIRYAPYTPKKNAAIRKLM